MVEFTRQLMYGQSPVHRSNPTSGQSEWYYIDPRYGDDDPRRQIDVPSEFTPNPRAGEIQNHLYNNDEYNYKQLYGNAEPPSSRGNNVQQLKPAGYQQIMSTPDNLLEYDPNTFWGKVGNAANDFIDSTKALAVGYTTGATLGNFDEMMGGATALVTGDTNNYAMGRDATRQLQNDLRERHPYVYGASEFVGAAMSPMHLFKGATRAQKIFNAATDTLNASAGYAENWNDFGANLVANGAANTIGYKLEQLPLSRTFGPVAKKAFNSGSKFIKQGFNSFADIGKNMVYNPNENDY